MIKFSVRTMSRVSEAVKKLESGLKVAADSVFKVPDNFHSLALVKGSKFGGTKLSG